MQTSAIYLWVLLGGALATFYFLACNLTEERVRKWFRKGAEQEDELQIKRIQTFMFPVFVSFAAILAGVLVFVTIDAMCGELPNRITGRWPICEGTIVGWSDGYRGSSSAMIQVGETTKGYRIRNWDIRRGEMVGVTVRMACNGDDACILEYKESGSWVRKMYLPNFGREANAVPKTIALNLLAGIFTCGCILKKILRPKGDAVLRHKALCSVAGGFLVACTLAGEVLLWLTVVKFENTWLGETQMVHSQLFVLVLLCVNVLFCILVTPKSDGYRYWWRTGKEFFKELEQQEKQ